MPDEAGRRHQAIDEPGALVRIGRFDISARLGRRGNPAGQVERQPADQGGVVGHRRRLDASLRRAASM